MASIKRSRHWIRKALTCQRWDTMTEHTATFLKGVLQLCAHTPPIQPLSHSLLSLSPSLQFLYVFSFLLPILVLPPLPDFKFFLWEGSLPSVVTPSSSFLSPLIKSRPQILGAEWQSKGPSLEDTDGKVGIMYTFAPKSKASFCTVLRVLSVY